ncbi:protein toll-like [Drosophila albomicans]|uniref:Protein toll-like n=1 Tax=Drosophila albomicans TaxID=7291 RepID=A0A6P8ZFD6_DROAB|nr:protein toll-like [Drosophila albomicans]
MVNISTSSICKRSLSQSINIIILIGIFFGIIITIFVYFYYKKSILKCLYKKNICGRCIKRPDYEENLKKNDAFLAFSHKDLDLIDEYVEKLERGPAQYQLCFYHRDWLIGESIPNCIVNSIEDSSRIIILLTEHFVQSSWGRFEFRSAIEATTINKYKRLIIIVYSGVDLNDLDSELKNYLKFNTYLRRDDPQFWKKLMLVMPQRKQTDVTPKNDLL